MNALIPTGLARIMMGRMIEQTLAKRVVASNPRTGRGQGDIAAVPAAGLPWRRIVNNHQ
jgi:hypothetical protein